MGLVEAYKKLLFAENLKKEAKSLTFCRIFSRLSKKNIIFYAFAARKFGSYQKNTYLCNVRMKVLATPLSAGSKALQILLHLNKRLHHVWCGFFIARISCGTACRT